MQWFFYLNEQVIVSLIILYSVIFTQTIQFYKQLIIRIYLISNKYCCLSVSLPHFYTLLQNVNYQSFFFPYLCLSVFLSPLSLSFGISFSIISFFPLFFSSVINLSVFFRSFTFSVLFSICYQKVRLFILRVPKFILLPFSFSFSFSSSPFDHFFSYLTFCV